MDYERACLIINPRAGQNFAKLNDLLAVFWAAGWKTDIAIKVYGGHAMKLATRAAEEGYDLVIAYGGDGTLSQVMNGVMNARGQRCVVGLIPGGTANQWASELGIPIDPVKAAITLVTSQMRKVDIGHIDVRELIIPDVHAMDGQDQKQQDARPSQHRNVKARSKAKHHFLLTAGLGIDAAVISNVSKSLKYRMGRLAFGVAAMHKMGEQHPFPVQIKARGAGDDNNILWEGRAIQVLLGNTRRYADVVELTPYAHIDDGILDMCVITSGTPLSTMQQITSLLLRRKPDDTTTEYFHGTHFVVSIPATIDIQLDGSAVKLKDYLGKSDWKALQQTPDPEQVMVDYHFRAMPYALRVAVPRGYSGDLFEEDSTHGEAHRAQKQSTDVETEAAGFHERINTGLFESKAEAGEDEQAKLADDKASEESQREIPQLVTRLLDHGRKVKVVAVSAKLEKNDMYIVAGGAVNSSTGEIKPVAVQIKDNTILLRYNGETAPPDIVEQLREGMEIMVEGKKNKRGVIAAQRVVV